MLSSPSGSSYKTVPRAIDPDDKRKRCFSCHFWEPEPGVNLTDLQNKHGVCYAAPHYVGRHGGDLCCRQHIINKYLNLP